MIPKMTRVKSSVAPCVHSSSPRRMRVRWACFPRHWTSSSRSERNSRKRWRTYNMTRLREASSTVFSLLTRSLQILYTDKRAVAPAPSENSASQPVPPQPDAKRWVSQSESWKPSSAPKSFMAIRTPSSSSSPRRISPSQLSLELPRASELHPNAASPTRLPMRRPSIPSSSSVARDTSE